MIYNKKLIRDAARKLAEQAAGVRIMVVGDVMLDRFVYGAVERISPEAPVPVVDVNNEISRLGGSANVVCNLGALGAEAELVGVVGRDVMADQIDESLSALHMTSSGLVRVDDRPTAVKTRVIAQHQQVVRFDRESRAPLAKPSLDALRQRIKDGMARVSAVIVSDYGKGVVSEATMEFILSEAKARNVLVAVDPKPVNALIYRGADLITPNRKETEAMSAMPAGTDEEAAAAAQALLQRLNLSAVLATRGENGMTLVQKSGEPVHIETQARDVFDVTGAGDTAISVMTMALAAKVDAVGAAALANLASGIVVGKLGTAVVSARELSEAAENGIAKKGRAN